MEDNTFQKVLDGGYYDATETAPVAGPGNVVPLPAQENNANQAINASMKLQGATSLPPNKAAELKRVLYDIGETIISMSEVVHNEAGFNDEDKYNRVADCGKVMFSVSQVISLSAEDASRVSKDPDLNSISQKAQEELTTLTTRIGDTFERHREGDLSSHQAASHLCALLLSVMEKCTTLLGLVDKHTVKVITIIGNQCKGVFHDMYRFFIESGLPTDNNPDFERFVSSMFKPTVENACDTFSRRAISITDSDLKERMLQNAIEIKNLAGDFEREVRNGHESAARDIKAKVWGIVDDACAKAAEVPAFCVVMNIDKISGEFDIKCAKFLNAVRGKNMAEVGAAGREITADINEGVRVGRMVPGMEGACNDAIAAAAETFTMAKKAMADSGEYPKVEMAVGKLKVAYALLPKQTLEVHSDSVNIYFEFLKEYLELFGIF